jgi:hypothetical protein
MQRAVNSPTESAAVTYGPERIRVNAIAPGNTRTEMIEAWESRTPGLVERLVSRTPLCRQAEPEEIAQAAAWLLSDRASFVTGRGAPRGRRGARMKSAGAAVAVSDSRPDCGRPGCGRPGCGRQGCGRQGCGRPDMPRTARPTGRSGAFGGAAAEITVESVDGCLSEVSERPGRGVLKTGSSPPGPNVSGPDFPAGLHPFLSGFAGLIPAGVSLSRPARDVLPVDAGGACAAGPSEPGAPGIGSPLLPGSGSGCSHPPTPRHTPTRPARTRLARIRRVRVRLAQARPVRKRLAQARSARVRPARVRPARVRPARVRPARVRPARRRQSLGRPGRVRCSSGSPAWTRPSGPARTRRSPG